MTDGLRRRLFFAGLYFAEGAPIGLVWWALPVWLRSAGVEPGEIGRIGSLATWPWALKMLWAPLVDLLRTPRFDLRGWIVTSQLFMALTIVPLFFLDLGAGGDLLVVALVAHAVVAATQDASIDTLAISTVAPHERGAINGWMQVGMLGARALFGGGAVLLARRIGQHAVLALLVAAILVPALTVALSTPTVEHVPRAERLARYREALRRAIGRREIWLGFLFTALVGAGFEGLLFFAGPLLLDRGADEALVGKFFLAPNVVAMALGALLGGRLSDRIGRRRAAATGEAFVALCALAVGAAAWLLPVSAGPWPFLGLVALTYFGAGLATAALYALLMDLTDPALGATQFCTFMAAVNLCTVWSTRALGLLVDAHGYGPGIVVLALVSLGALPLLLVLRR